MGTFFLQTNLFNKGRYLHTAYVNDRLKQSLCIIMVGKAADSPVVSPVDEAVYLVAEVCDYRDN